MVHPHTQKNSKFMLIARGFPVKTRNQVRLHTSPCYVWYHADVKDTNFRLKYLKTKLISNKNIFVDFSNEIDYLVFGKPNNYTIIIPINEFCVRLLFI